MNYEYVATTPPQVNPELNQAFNQDPFSALAQESERLFAVYHDPTMSEAERDQQLDGYFRTIEALDMQNFPNTDVTSGVPSGYIPDGFIDMGSLSSANPSDRYNRSMNYVDTYNTLARHKAVFAAVFAGLNPADFAGDQGRLRFQQTIISNVAIEIATTMPVGIPEPQERGGILPMSTVDTAICQQRALTSQVLLQAFGIRSRLSKNVFATHDDIAQGIPGGDHVSNIVTIPLENQEAEYMFDATNPQANKAGEWTFGLFRLGEQSADGGWTVTGVNGHQRSYNERDQMYSMVHRLPELSAA